MNNADMWNFPGQQDWGPADLVGYKVEATDGHIGKVDEASNEVGAHYIVVDTGPWIFGRKVLIPAGLLTGVDTSEEKIHLSLTKGQIKDSPDLNETTYRQPDYRDSIGGYYGGLLM